MDIKNAIRILLGAVCTAIGFILALGCLHFNWVNDHLTQMQVLKEIYHLFIFSILFIYLGVFVFDYFKN